MHVCVCVCPCHSLCVEVRGQPSDRIQSCLPTMWAPGMEFRLSALVAGTFTYRTILPTQSAILELEGRMERESTWLRCKAVYGVTHGKAGKKHYSTLPLSDSKPV